MAVLEDFFFYWKVSIIKLIKTDKIDKNSSDTNL